MTRPGQPPGQLCALTVDVEDWYQSCFDLDAPISDRVVANVHRTLTVLDVAGVKATFFVQGRVAEAHPSLIEAIAAEGHEIQSHGYSHRSLLAMERAELRAELRAAKESVENACGAEVTAFRAPDFSILASNLWALEVLAEMGFQVDSSIFPRRARRYGIAGWDPGPRLVRLPGGNRIIEAPVTVWTVGRARVPVAGGGYWRLLPGSVLERGIGAALASGRPAVLYCHPYEFSPDELRDYRDRVPPHLRMSQGAGRRAAVARLIRLLDAFRFDRLDAALAAWDATLPPAVRRAHRGLLAEEAAATGR